MGLDRRSGLVETNTMAIGCMESVQAQVDTLGKTVTCIMENLKMERSVDKASKHGIMVIRVTASG